MAAGAPRTISVAANDAVPQGAVAVAYNITAADTKGSGYLAVAPGGTSAAPATSSLNWSNAGEVVANGFTVGVNSERSIAVFGGGSGSTQFVVDIVGFYAPETVTPAGCGSVPIDPARAYDSRSAGQTALPVGSSRQVSVAAGGKVPANATGVAFPTSPRPTLPEQDSCRWRRVVNPSRRCQPSTGTATRPWPTAPPWESPTAPSACLRAAVARRISSWTWLGYLVPAASAPQGARFTATAPVRTYDSRQASGPLTGGTRTDHPREHTRYRARRCRGCGGQPHPNRDRGRGLLGGGARTGLGPPAHLGHKWTGDQTLANGMLLKSGATPEVSVYAGPSSQGVGAELHYGRVGILHLTRGGG